jgi:hypothetical protein
MSTSIVTICNAALQFIGAARITALDDGTREADAADFYWDLVRPVVFRAVPWRCISKRVVLADTTLTGTVTVEAGTPTTVDGTETAFTTELVVGDRIQIGTETRIVSAITSATELTVSEAFSAAADAAATLIRVADTPAWGFAYAYYLPGDFVRMVRTYSADDEYHEIGGLLHTDLVSPEIEYVYDCVDPTKYTADLVRCLYLNLAYELAYCLTQNTEVGDRVKADLEKFFLPIVRFNNSIGAGLETPKSDTLTDIFW